MRAVCIDSPYCFTKILSVYGAYTTKTIGEIN